MVGVAPTDTAECSPSGLRLGSAGACRWPSRPSLTSPHTGHQGQLLSHLCTSAGSVGTGFWVSVCPQDNRPLGRRDLSLKPSSVCCPSWTPDIGKASGQAHPPHTQHRAGFRWAMRDDVGSGAGRGISKGPSPGENTAPSRTSALLTTMAD